MFARLTASTLALALLIALAGCDKVPAEAKSLLQTSALAAKERASAFGVIKPRIVAANKEDRALLQRGMTSHANQLNAQADALAKLCDAVNAGGKLSDQTRDGLKAEAVTQKFVVACLRAELPKIANNPDVDKWLADHVAALDAQQVSLEKLAALLAKENKAALPPPTIEKGE